MWFQRGRIVSFKTKEAGKSINKCIKYGGKWVTPSEFETLAGSHARKWKQNIILLDVRVSKYYYATHYGSDQFNGLGFGSDVNI